MVHTDAQVGFAVNGCPALAARVVFADPGATFDVPGAGAPHQLVDADTIGRTESGRRALGVKHATGAALVAGITRGKVRTGPWRGSAVARSGGITRAVRQVRRRAPELPSLTLGHDA